MMKRPFVAWGALVFIIAVASCNSSKGGASLVALAQGCTLNSDCNAPLVCVFSLCHEECVETRDCPAGEQCVATSGGDVCLLSSETSCSPTTSCPSGLVCGSDGRCHDACNASTSCSVGGQSCIDGVCVDTADGGGSILTEAGPLTDGNAGGADGGDATAGDSAMNDGPGPPMDAGPLGFAGSNVGPTVPTASADGGPLPVVHVSTTCDQTCLPPPTSVTQGDGTTAALYVVQSLTVDSTATISIHGTTPAILVVLGAADIQGVLDVGSTAFNQPVGAGGFAWHTPGKGVGQTGGAGSYGGSGPGGGSFCGVGGNGAAATGQPAPGGQTYGVAPLVPLVGGSAGGDELPGLNRGGAGGGAVQISARDSITVGPNGAINAGGGAYCQCNGMGAGGSGGAILLEAPTVTIAGALGANGGGGADRSTGVPEYGNATSQAMGSQYSGAGSWDSNLDGGAGTVPAGQTQEPFMGSGGGGAGRIRINTSSGSATINGGSTVSPALGTACTTQGTLN
jgi:hypothetical protein